MGRTMEAGPPALVEAIAARLIPPAAREHVLGDLRERYVSTPQYVAEAMRVIPAVVSGRVRRTFDGLLASIQTFSLFLVFRPSRFAYHPDAALPILLPIGAALLALTLRDAYAAPELPDPHGDDEAFDAALKRALVAAALAMTAAAVPQALLVLLDLCASWRLRTDPLFTGLFGGFIMLVPARIAWTLLFRANGHRRLMTHGIARETMTPAGCRAALVKRRDVLRRSWLWYVAFFAAVNFLPLAIRSPQLTGPLAVETLVTVAAILLLRRISGRLADRAQREIDDLD